jgi:beta-lactam-binding protein with PASTA domain
LVVVLGVGATPAAAAGGSVSSPSVSLSTTAAGATQVTYTIDFSTSATGALAAGDTISLVGSPGTLWPSGLPSYVLTDTTTSSGSFPSAAGVTTGEPGIPIFNFESSSGSVVTIKVPNAINAGDAVTLAVTGVINPAAGSDELSISTSADSTDAAAPYTVTDPGSVATPSASLSSTAAAATAVDYTVGFTTSATGAIPAGGTITLVGPAGTLWPTHNNCAYTLTDATTSSGSFACASNTSYGEPGLPVYSFNAFSGQAVTITVPNAIKAGDNISLAIVGAANAGPGSHTLSISTSADPKPVTSAYSLTAPRSVGSQSVSVEAPASGGTSASYTVGFTTSTTGAIPAGGTITLIAAPGTLWPAHNNCAFALTDATTPSASFSCAQAASFGGPGLPVYTFNSFSGEAVTLTVPNAIKAGDSLSLAITGVTNAGAGSHAMTILTSADPKPVTASYSVTAAQAVVSPAVSLSSQAAGATHVGYTVDFSTSATGAIAAGGTITVAAAPGTTLPTGCNYMLADSTTPTANFTCPSAVRLSGGGSTVTLSVPNAIKGGDALSLVVSDVTNPGSGAGTIQVSTSADGKPASAAYSIVAAGSASKPTVTSDSDTGGATDVGYTVAFSTSATGNIAPGGTITLVADPGMTWPSSSGCDYVLTDTTSSIGSFACATGIQLNATASTVTITVPNFITAGDALSLAISGVTNPAGGSHTLSLLTSADPTPVTSSSYSMTGSPATLTAVSSASLSATSTTGGASGVSDTVTFTTSASGALAGGSSTIALAAPAGTNLAGPNTAYSIVDETTSSGSGPAGRTSSAADGAFVDITPANTIAAGDTVQVTITQVTNPPAATGTLLVSTSADQKPVSVGDDTTAPQSISAASFTASTTASGANAVTYTVTFTTSSTGRIVGGSGTISLAAPAGTLLGTCPFGCGGGNATYTIVDATTSSGSGPATPTEFVGGQSIDVTPMHTIEPGDTITLTITQVTNPPAGAGKLAISTSSDVKPVSATDTTTAQKSVSAASFSASTTSAGANGVTYTVDFTTSSTGEVEGGIGSISLVTPAGTLLAPCAFGCGGGNPTYTITDDTTPSGSGPAAPSSVSNDGASVDVMPANTIKAGDHVELTFTQVTNPPAQTGTIAISTSSDKAPVTTTDTTTAVSSVSAPSLSASSTAGGANGVTYTVTFTASATAGSVLGGLGAISLEGPAGTVFGPCPFGCGGGNSTYTIDDETTSSGSGSAAPSSVSNNGASVDIMPTNTIKAGDTIKLTITQVTNPPAGPGKLAVSTSSDKQPVTVADTTTPPRSVGKPSVAVASDTPGGNTTYTVGFNASPSGALVGGLSTVTLIGSPGTQFPSGGSATITDNTTSSGSGTVPNIHTTDGGQVADLTVPNAIAANDSLTITIPNVDNPPSDVGAIRIATTSDKSPAQVLTPTGVTATAGNVSADVSWTAPAASEGPITGYGVTPYIGSTAQTPATFSGSTTSGTVGGLTNGTTYTFRVAAVTHLGTGPQSPPSNAVTPKATVGGPPAVALSTGVLSFGTVAVGKASSAQTVTVSNSGSDALQISSATISGADAGDFSIGTNSCSGHSIAGGKSCSIAITFSPTAGGARTASLSLADNAANSPQSVSLNGSATHLGELTGYVLDGSASGAPVSGAGVDICPQTGSTATGSACQFQTTGPNGQYDFSNLQPGLWLMQVSSPTPSLFGASAIVDIVAGGQTQDLTLSAPQPLPKDVTIISSGGKTHGGVPVLNWNSPFTMTFSPAFPSEPAGTELAYIATVALYNAGSGSSAAITSGTLVLLIEYGSSGPTVTAQYVDPTSGPNPEVTVDGVNADLRARTAAAGIGGIVMDYLVPKAKIQANVPSVRTATHGATSIQIDRSYVVVGTPGSGAAAPQCEVPAVVGEPMTEAGPAIGHAHCKVGTVTRVISATVPKNDVISTAPAGGSTHPAGAAVNVHVSNGPPVRKPAASARCSVPPVVGLPVLAAHMAIAKAHCKNGAVTHVRSPSVAVGRVISSSPAGGTTHPAGFTVGLRVSLGPPPKPKRGPKVRAKGPRIGITSKKPPKSPKCCRIKIPPDGGDGYYDPSGTVQSTTGIPLSGASVSLLSATTLAGPFGPVPNGSVVMSPENRQNPDATDALGHFGWDVVPGFYEVSASHSGCTNGSGGPYTVPPPVSGIVIKLACAHLKRGRSHVKLRVKRLKNDLALVTVSVRGKKPSGLVKITARGFRTTLPLTRHSASFVVTAGGRIGAKYLGDGANKPSSARARS